MYKWHQNQSGKGFQRTHSLCFCVFLCTQIFFQSIICIISNFVIMKKGFYIRKAKDGSFVLNVNTSDFKAFLDTLPTNEGWIRFRIYERDNVDEKGFTHNMEVIMNLNKQEGNHGEQ